MGHRFFLSTDCRFKKFAPLSALELFGKCLSKNSGDRENALVVLFTRVDQDALAYQDKFIYAWQTKPEDFAWLHCSRDVRRAFLFIINQPFTPISTCKLVLHWLAEYFASKQNAKHPPNTTLSAEIMQKTLEALDNPNWLIHQAAYIYLGQHPIDFLEVASAQELLLALEKIFPTWDRYLGHLLIEAYVKLVEQLPHLERLNYIKPLCSIILIGTVALKCLEKLIFYLSADHIEYIIPYLYTALRYYDKRSHARFLIMSLFVRLPQENQQMHLQNLKELLKMSDDEVRSNACYQIAALAPLLPANLVSEFVLQLAGRVQSDNSVDGNFLKAWFKLFIKLPELEQHQNISVFERVLSINGSWGALNAFLKNTQKFIPLMTPTIALQMTSLTWKLMMVYPKNAHRAAGRFFFKFLNHIPKDNKEMFIRDFIQCLASSPNVAWRNQAFEILLSFASKNRKTIKELGLKHPLNEDDVQKIKLILMENLRDDTNDATCQLQSEMRSEYVVSHRNIMHKTNSADESRRTDIPYFLLPGFGKNDSEFDFCPSFDLDM